MGHSLWHFDAKIALYGSPDLLGNYSFVGYLLGADWEGSAMYECPDFYPLRNITATAQRSRVPADFAAVKTSNEFVFQDFVRCGRYNATSRVFAPSCRFGTDCPAGTAAAPPHLENSYLVDFGRWYASKTFWDTRQERRVLWGWVNEDDDDFAARGWAGMQSLPRHVRYNPALQRLETPPIPELRQLRKAVAANVSTPQMLRSGAPMAVVNASGTEHTPRQLEIHAKLRVRREAVAPGREYKLGLNVLAGSGNATFVGVYTVAATAAWLNATDQPGGDFLDLPMDAAAPRDAQIANCTALCNSDPRCVAWTFVAAGNPGPLPPFQYAPRCSLKSKYVPRVAGRSDCVSGLATSPLFGVDRRRSATTGNLTPDVGQAHFNCDAAYGTCTVALHVFVDHSIVEAYKDGGLERAASRLYVPPSTTAAPRDGVEVVFETDAPSAPAAMVDSVTVWELGSIWG